MISACEKDWQWEWALGLLEEMGSNGVTCSTITYNTVISACEKGEQLQMCYMLYAQALVASCFDHHFRDCST